MIWWILASLNSEVLQAIKVLKDERFYGLLGERIIFMHLFSLLAGLQIMDYHGIFRRGLRSGPDESWYIT